MALKEYGVQNVVNEIVKDVEKYQSDYMTNVLDGFRLYRCGYIMLRMLRRNKEATLDENGRTGFIEFNDLRDHYFRKNADEYFYKQEQMFSQRKNYKCTIV